MGSSRLFRVALALLAPLCHGLVALKNAGVAEMEESFNSSTKPPLAIWVHAFARSGSSTILSLVSVENQTEANKKHGGFFTLFEPCQAKDALHPRLAMKGCVGLLHAISRCEFQDIHGLQGWTNVHTKKRGAPEKYAPQKAAAACAGADVVAFKTISRAYEQFHINDQAMSLLEKESRVRLVDVIRDPRSIYSSWLTTFPFNDTQLGGLGRDVSAMLGICDTFASNLRVSHPHVHRIVFEDLVKNPSQVVRETYAFLGLPSGGAQENWVRKTFNAKACPGVDHWIAPYSDCHTESSRALDRWRSTLTDDEKRAFATHKQCVDVAKAYGYEL
jgi:hypothetical protein|eukprot:TRINITY_DN13085_c0_g4_i1.p1 TRINITY_DN13085_c0_g4~~TRINITY_DN13085_c0_g4_i1.p1  ORF type:complete len:331 (-),score=55.37 TRINITY_DN13085_c0_g4_i1:63-1055(-)